MAIVHGGIHTINECIMLKVPMLIYSGKKSDQDGNAARLIYHGLTYKTDKDLDTSEDICKKIIALSEDENIRNKMKEMYQLSQEQLRSNYLNELIEGALQSN
jgi:UDP:flavonoid glycosyltransferase YjiC (YdhE family)